jgi:alkylation response protein AidB-like acyl-CoA dehydrogenase
MDHMPGLLDVTPRQQQIMEQASTLARVLEARVTDNDLASVFPMENFRDLHESGYLRLALPVAHGGAGANVFEMVLAQEILGRADASTALVCGMNLSLMGRVLDNQAWPEPVLAEICQTLSRDGGTINNCVTEADLGSISRGGLPAMTAEATDGGWLLSGRKIFVTGATALRFLATATVLPPSDDHPTGQLAYALVEGGTPGLSIIDTWSGALGLRGCGNYDVVYDRVFVPARRIVEALPIGQHRRPQGGSAWALPLAAIALGIGQAACDTACHYANNRVPSGLGQPIATQPHIQNWIGQMDMQLRAARSVLHETARACVAGKITGAAITPAVAAAKYLCTNAACSVTEIALRVAGGFSMTRALPLERYFRDARGGLFQPPQDDLALMMIGRVAMDAEKARNPA